MKTGVIVSIVLLGLILFSGCGNGKQLQEGKPLQTEQAFYTTWTGGVKGAASGFNLYVPLKVEDREVQPDSAWFRGRRAKLVPAQKAAQATDNFSLYVASFRTSEREKAPDLIMHKDPRQEYGNRPPEIIRDFPYDLEEGEAVISYKKNGEKGYMRLAGIEAHRENNDVKIKRPENLQH